MTEPDYVLSVEEFDIVWGDLGGGRVPYPLEAPSVGATMQRRARLREQIYLALTDRGLAVGTRLAPRLWDMVRLLGEHDLSVDLVGYAGAPLRAVAATDHRDGVLASLVGDSVTLTGIRPSALTWSIVRVLPPNDAGHGRALSVRKSALAAAIDPDLDDPFADESDELTALRRAGVSNEDASALLDLADNRVAGGQFGISHAGRRESTLLTWFDTRHGRHLMVSEDSWLSFAPADHDRIEHRLAEVLAKAARAR